MKFLFDLAMVAIFIGPAFAGIDTAEYLFEFGYLDKRNPTPEQMKDGIFKFQRYNRLPATGKLDDQTIQLLNTPRCGEKDIQNHPQGEHLLTKRSLPGYKLVSMWPKKIITWKIESYSKTSRLPKFWQRDAIIRGINRWLEFIPLVFKEVTGEADVTFGFVQKAYHGPPGHSPFTPHAFFPPRTGSIHFWDLRNWSLGNYGGYDLEAVAAHEMGHVLGLNHSGNRAALMYGPYLKRRRDFTLGPDDIAGIEALYGKKSDKVISRTPKRNSSSNIPYPLPTGKGFCNHDYKRIDAAMRINKIDFVFVDNGSTVIDGRTGLKMAINDLFPKGPQSVDAAVFSVAAYRAYLFQGKRVWAYILNANGQFLLVNNFPKYRFGQNVDAAFRMEKSGKEDLILIRDKVWFYFTPYHEEKRPSKRYPTPFSFLYNPQQIDAAISSDKDIYFTIGKKAYKMSIDNSSIGTQGTPINLAFEKCRS